MSIIIYFKKLYYLFLCFSIWILNFLRIIIQKNGGKFIQQCGLAILLTWLANVWAMGLDSRGAQEKQQEIKWRTEFVAVPGRAHRVKENRLNRAQPFITSSQTFRFQIAPHASKSFVPSISFFQPQYRKKHALPCWPLS